MKLIKQELQTRVSSMFWLLIVIVSVVTVIAGSSALAYADSGNLTNEPATLPCEHGDLTIRLPQHNPYDQVPAGKQPYGDGSGYRFSLSPLTGYDINDANQWNEITNLRAEELSTTQIGKPLVEKSTVSPGIVRFLDVPAGVYLVHVQAPLILSTNNPEVSDFVVTVPLADVDGWKCNATIYAKQLPEVTPPTPHHPKTPESPVPPSPLPKTGVDIAGYAVIGMALISVGLAFVASRESSLRKRPGQVSDDSSGK